MADEARFTFEFVDKSGNTTTNKGPGSQNGGASSDTAGAFTSAANNAGGAAGLAAGNSARNSASATQANTIKELASATAQIGSAMKGAPSNISEVIGRSQLIGGAVGRAAATTGAAEAGAAGSALAGPVAVGTALAAAPLLLAAAVAKGSYDRMGEIANSPAADFSPDIARAKAEAEVRQIQNDIRTAQRTGPTVAAFVENQSFISQDFQRVKDSLVEGIGPEINKVLSVISLLTAGLAKFAEDWEKSWAAWRAMTPELQKAFADIEAIAKAAHDQNKPFDMVTWFEKQPMPAPAGMQPGPVEVEVAGVQFAPMPGLNL